MQYLICFLEGVITFISPCLLPMLPVYITYFAGGQQRKPGQTLTGALGFVAGFTLVFVALGTLAGTVGGFLARYRSWVDLVCGGLVAVFGLGYLGVLRLPSLAGRLGSTPKGPGLTGALVFGMVFALGWTPCVGAFLGSALMLASQQGTALAGLGMLLCYSLGLGLPFVVSALLIDGLKDAFAWIKGHYGIINKVCGGLLVLLGLLMATGTLGRLLTALS